MTYNRGRSRPLGPGNHKLTCEVCGVSFFAKRSDARFHSAACRQANHRRQHDPVRSPAPTATTKDRSWKRSPEESLTRAIHLASAGGLALGGLEIILRHADVPAAVSAPDAPLEGWDKELTETIRLLSKVRQAVRTEQASRRRA